MCKLYFYDMDIENETFWIPEYETGIIFEGNIKTGHTKIISRDMYKTFKNKCFFRGIYNCGDKLLLANQGEQNAIIYNRFDNQFYKTQIRNLPSKSVWDFQHDSIIETEKNYYIILVYGEIVKADKELCEFECIGSIPNDTKESCYKKVVKKDKCIYVLIKNKIYAFNSETETYFECNMFETENNIETMCFDGTFFWISTNSGEIICSDKKRRLQIEQDKLYLLNESPGVRKFLESYCCNDIIWLVPCYVDRILCFDIKSMSIRPFLLPGEEENSETLNRVRRKNKQKVIASIRLNEELLVLSSKTEQLYRVDMVKKRVEILKCDIDRRTLMSERLKLAEIITEGTNINIKDYIEYWRTL